MDSASLGSGPREPAAGPGEGASRATVRSCPRAAFRAGARSLGAGPFPASRARASRPMSSAGGTMSSPVRKPLARAFTVAVTAVLLLTTAFVGGASAHGSTIDPASRNYGCWKRWGSDFQNPAMATEDPMCWQAWQTEPNAMWNWNGLYKEQVNNNHQAAIPNGQLCSGGLAEGGRYRAMDTVGDWKASNISNNFTVKLHDQAKHGATYIYVYVTKQGFN